MAAAIFSAHGYRCQEAVMSRGARVQHKLSHRISGGRRKIELRT
jgi:hypothetical protein